MDKYLQQITILYVEDEEYVRDGYTRALKRVAKEVYTAKNGEEGLLSYKKYKPDIVVTDIRMPKKNGILMAQEIKNINPNQIILFMTAYTGDNYTLKALDLQIDGYIVKPVDKKKFIHKLSIFAKNILIDKENLKKTQIIQNILDKQSNITILTDFKNIEFASKSFLHLFKVNSIEEFSLKYKNCFPLLEPKSNYIYAQNKNDFLYQYKNNPEKLISIVIDNTKRDFYINIDPIKTNEKPLYIISLTDITTLQKEKEKIEYNATHDFLTKLYNRTKFNELLNIEFIRAKRYKRPLCIAMFDIDYFKKINDIYGHLTGDKILKELASFFLNHTREIDFFFRWGGEEFILLMSEIDIKNAKFICEKIRKDVESKNFVNDIKLTISAGVTQLIENDTKDTFLQRLDEALYISKKNGRNRTTSLPTEK